MLLITYGLLNSSKISYQLLKLMISEFVQKTAIPLDGTHFGVEVNALAGVGVVAE